MATPTPPPDDGSSNHGCTGFKVEGSYVPAGGDVDKRAALGCGDRYQIALSLTALYP
jgi:hypothetical protein